VTASVIGWVATATQAASYLFRKERTLTMIQAISALLWLTFGLVIVSAPVVVANVIVCGAALYATFRRRRVQVARWQ
jgi:hypothetical protein